VDEKSERFKPLRKFVNALGKIYLSLSSYSFHGCHLKEAYKAWSHAKEGEGPYQLPYTDDLPEDSFEWFITELNYVNNLLRALKPKSYPLTSCILKIRLLSLEWCLFFCYVREQLKANDIALIELNRAIEFTKDNFYKPLSDRIFNLEYL
jgi:hypothetical protein